MPNNNVFWTIVLVLAAIALIIFIAGHVTFS